ncbi:putative RAVE complex protein Rav1 [Plasmopara halstedii]
MVFRLEESIVAVCAPPANSQADLLICQAVFEANRYIVYALESLLVVLVEVFSVPTGVARFELWQVWHSKEAIKCVRFNASKKVAHGALALCIDDGGGVLLLPTSATSVVRAAAVAHGSRASTMNNQSDLLRPSVASNTNVIGSEHVKTHLHLCLPKWAEFVRWQCDDRMLNHLEWVESGDNILLLGVGEKLSIWKLVDDSVQLYLQRTIILSGGIGSRVKTSPPDMAVSHFDVARSGKFVATACKNDRIVKVWHLGELSPLEGAPKCMFLAHTRALVSMMWSKDMNVYSTRSAIYTTTQGCEILFALDREGTISIWRVNVVPLRSIMLWKRFTVADVRLPLSCEIDANCRRHIRIIGLVNHCWTRRTSNVSTSINEALLGESTAMEALCLFHFGCGSLNEAHQNGLIGQRSDSVANMNIKLLGDHSGVAADTISGEEVIFGNVAVGSTFDVHLLFGVFENGDFCIIRVEAVPFTGASSNLSLLLNYSKLREHLLDAHVYSVCSTKCQDSELKSGGFCIEVLFQQKKATSYLQCARLEIQAESCAMNARRGLASFSVQSFEIHTVCSNMIGKLGEKKNLATNGSVANVRLRSHTDSAALAVNVPLTNLGGALAIFDANESLQKLQVALRSKIGFFVGSVTHTTKFEGRKVIHTFINGKLHVLMVKPSETNEEIKAVECAPFEHLGSQMRSLMLAACFVDENSNLNTLSKLIAVDIPDFVKAKWCDSSSYLLQPAKRSFAKDYSMLVGLHKGESKLTVWVFSFDLINPPTVDLSRKTAVKIHETEVLDVASVPAFGIFQIIFATFDQHSQLALWTFADMIELLEVRLVHKIDVGVLLQMANRAQRSHMESTVSKQEFTFKHFTFSLCGRVAILFEGRGSEAVDKICFIPALETIMEGVVNLSHKQFGHVKTLEWTPQIMLEQECDLLFLSTTTIGLMKFDCSLPMNKWSIAWSLNRFSVRPEDISSLSGYPYGLLRVGPSLAHLNLQDFDHTSSLQQPIGLDPLSKALPAHHPIVLTYLVARGSFHTIQTILEFVKKKIIEHEETCYLRMTDDSLLQTLPLLSLSQLLEDMSHTTEGKENERLNVNQITKKSLERNGARNYGAAVLAPARASDHLTMKFGPSCQNGACSKDTDRADLLFATPASTSSDSLATEEAISKFKLNTDEYLFFFSRHKSSLTFMTKDESNMFFAVIASIKKIVSWVHDNSRQKDEAAIRFYASLIWPVDPIDVSTELTTTYLETPDQQSTDARTLRNRAVSGLCSEQVAWGALSDFQTELLQECFSSVKLSWNEMRRSRLPFWLKSSAKLVHFVEKVAQAEYAANRDPFVVAVFYVLLGKTTLLATLFKLASETRIAELLSKNFTEMRWKNAALKNAYVLKTKQRYELSAAFFILGGKLSEAVSVAGKADESLVLSFLIARISAKWDLGGHSSFSGAVKPLIPFTGVNSSLRETSQFELNSGNLTSDDDFQRSAHLCMDFLRTTVWDKASKCGDLYMCFLVKYYLGEFSNAVSMLVTPPAIEMRSMFDGAGVAQPNMYWSAFGRSLLGACNLFRFLRNSSMPVRLITKNSIVRLNATAIIRLQDTGFEVCALLHQRDMASFIRGFREESATSLDVAAFMAYRQRILNAAVGSQMEFLYATFLKTTRKALITPSSSASDIAQFNFEDRVNEEIQNAVCGGGDFNFPGSPELTQILQHKIRTAVVESLIHSGRLVALDFLVCGWKQPGFSASEFGFKSPLPQLVEVIAEGIATVASGDLISAATDRVHTRKVDQTCSILLTSATRLLFWLQYLYLKPAKQRAAFPNRNFVYVAVAAVHSAICICCRYIKTACCLNRVLGIVFSHKSDMSLSSQEALTNILSSDNCVNCASLSRFTNKFSDASFASSFSERIRVLYAAVCALEVELDEFTAEVKTSRLHHSMPSRSSLDSFLLYCPYRELVLIMAAGEMPNHLLKLAADDIVSTSNLSMKLVEAWKNYNHRLAEFALKHLLCDLAGVLFGQPLNATSLTSPRFALPASPKETASPSRSSVTDSPSAFIVDAPNASPSQHQTRMRQLLKCDCERCPWVFLLERFTDKHELLLRLNAHLECCREKLHEEVRWGRLPEPTTRNIILTRSQKLLLSSVTDSAPTFSLASKYADHLKRRTMMSMPRKVAIHVQCVYRSETTIKGICFNRAVCDDVGVSVCGSKGIFRASCVDYADGCRLQFRGVYAPPHSSVISAEYLQVSPVKINHRHEVQSNVPPLNNYLTARSPPSPLRNSAHLLASPSEPGFKPTALASHPFLPLFVSGDQKGRVHLWSYDRLSAVCAFQTKDTVAPSSKSPSMLSGRRSVKALGFDNLGQQLGAVDAMGRLFMWKFIELDRAPYYCEIGCHDKGAKGLVFLNSSSSLATVGTSSEKRTVCVWDTLLPTSKALIAAPVCHTAGATAVAFSSTYQLLITGGAGGALSIFDMRQRRVLHTISNAHETPIKTIVLHPGSDCVLSGSAGGDVKIWSLPLFREVAFLGKVHVKSSFLSDAATNFLSDAASNVAINVTNSSWGVTYAVATEDAFFTSGTDGSVQRLTIPSLWTRPKY